MRRRARGDGSRSGSVRREAVLAVLVTLLAPLLGCGSDRGLRRDLPWVRDIDFRGNEHVGERTIESVMSLRTPSLFHPFRRSYYFRDLLDKDLDLVRDLYRDHGFLDFQVVEIDEQFDSDRESVRLAVTVEEGPITRVRSVSFQGNASISESKLRGVVHLKPGSPFSPFVSRGDLERIRVAYLDEGYAFVKADLDIAAAGAVVDVAYRVEEGRQAHLNALSASGNETTQRRYITREVTIERGGLYKRSELLETQKRLNELGLFSSVRLQTVVADTAKGLVDLQIDVRERKHGWYGFGFGFWSDERFRVSAEWGHRNVWGTARRIRTSGSIGWDVDSLVTGGADKSYSELELQATWVEPWFLGTRTEGTFAVYKDYERHPLAFEYNTIGLRGTFRRELSRFVDLFLTLENEWVSSNDTTLTRDDFITQSVHVEVERDSRDNILDPRRGSLLRSTLQYAGLQGDYNFAKGMGSVSFSFPQNRARTRILALRGQLGYIEPISSPLVRGDRDRLDQIPYRDRFFIGGATTLRGYERQELGPLGADGLTRGGTALLLMNVEYRFPIVWKIRGGVFVDAGNIWADPSEFKPSRLIGEFGSDYSPLDVRYAAGVGGRLETPVGPLRVDYARKVGTATGGQFERNWEIHFSLGNAF